jgi:hypothetical protein
LTPWPAESLAQALDLTAVEGPLPNDFAQDLSGLHWNTTTRVLWATRNGGTGGSKAWALEEDGNGSMRVGTRGGVRAEWTGLGDAESVTQAPGMVDDVLVIDEATGVVTQWDFSVGETHVAVTSWDLSAFLPVYNGDLGPEAMTFVPDAALVAGGFVDGSGAAWSGGSPLGGLLFVGHQAGGNVYAFVLGANGMPTHVGTYATGVSETAGLEWDAHTAHLLAWHSASFNQLSVLRLSSEPGTGGVRVFHVDARFDSPGSGNHEGMAVMDTCTGNTRWLWLATDDGGDHALRVFTSFPCDL